MKKERKINWQKEVSLIVGITFLFLAVVLFANDLIQQPVLFAPPTDAVMISSCQELDHLAYYALSTDIEANATCFSITADGITLDGNGHKISLVMSPEVQSDLAGVAIMNKNDVIITNLEFDFSTEMQREDINYFSSGIYILNSADSRIQQNTFVQEEGFEDLYFPVSTDSTTRLLITDNNGGDWTLVSGSDTIMNRNSLDRASFSGGINNSVHNNTISSVVFNSITESFIQDNLACITLTNEASRNIVSGNDAEGCAQGIAIASSHNNTLTDNIIANGAEGITISEGQNNTLERNSLNNNSYNFVLTPSAPVLWSNNINRNTNLIDGEYALYVENGSSGQTYDGSILPKIGSLYCLSCSDIIVDSLALRHNGAGLYLMDNTNVTIRNVDASFNREGISAVNTPGVVIENSLANNNANYGIYLDSENNTLTNTVANYNLAGMRIQGSNNGIRNCVTSYNTQRGLDLGGIKPGSQYDKGTGRENQVVENHIANYNGAGINAYMISWSNLTNITLMHNAGRGLTLDSYCSNNLITNIDAEYNGDGMTILSSSMYNVIRNAILSNNIGHGFNSGIAAFRNNITYSRLNNNSVGIRFDSSLQSEIANSDISGNRDKDVGVHYSTVNYFRNVSFDANKEILSSRMGTATLIRTDYASGRLLIVNDSGTPVANAQVNITSVPTGFNFIGTTDSNGYLQLDGREYTLYTHMNGQSAVVYAYNIKVTTPSFSATYSLSYPDTADFSEGIGVASNDNTAPVLSITSPLAGTYTTKSISLSVSASDDVSGVTCGYSINGLATVMFNCGSGTTVNFGVNGDYTLTVYTWDSSLNEDSEEILITINAPEETVTGSPGGGGGGDSSCKTAWVCTNWSSCISGMQKRTCTKSASYCEAPEKPIEEMVCTTTKTETTPTEPIVEEQEPAITEPGKSFVEKAKEFVIKYKVYFALGLFVIIGIVIEAIISYRRARKF